MILRSLSFLFVASALLISGCTPVRVEPGTLVLEPRRLATFTFAETSIDFFCGLDRAPIPPTVFETDLQSDQIGAGFRNWHRHENLCGRRYTWVHQGLVDFDARPLRDLGRAIAIRSATLRVQMRMLRVGTSPDPFRSVADGSDSRICPRLRIPQEPWERGWHNISARTDLIETAEFPSSRYGDDLLGFPSEGERNFDVTTWVKRLVQRPSMPAEVALESISDLIYQNNNSYCLNILGPFRLEIEFDRIVPADS